MQILKIILKHHLKDHSANPCQSHLGNPSLFWFSPRWCSTENGLITTDKTQIQILGKAVMCNVNSFFSFTMKWFCCIELNISHNVISASSFLRLSSKGSSISARAILQLRTLISNRRFDPSRNADWVQSRGDNKTNHSFIPFCSPYFANTKDRQKRATRIKANLIKGPNHLPRIDKSKYKTKSFAENRELKY